MGSGGEGGCLFQRDRETGERDRDGDRDRDRDREKERERERRVWGMCVCVRRCVCT